MFALIFDNILISKYKNLKYGINYLLQNLQCIFDIEEENYYIHTILNGIKVHSDLLDFSLGYVIKLYVVCWQLSSTSVSVTENSNLSGLSIIYILTGNHFCAQKWQT